jgi:cell division protein FtsN
MTHDFAKIRPEPLLEKTPLESPPAWSLMITGIVVGLAIGVFACVLFYLSGNVPPLNANTKIESSMPSVIEKQFTAIEEPSVEQELELELEFYHELKNWEVPVEAKPVELTPEQIANHQPSNYVAAPPNAGFMLQTGAFQQKELAYQELERQLALGIKTIVRQEDSPGRTLYLVQSGPYLALRELSEAEQLFQKHNIQSMRISLQ